jgi:hypothetical protein
VVREPASIDSIFDFLYVDTSRLKSWLSQVSDDGVLSSHRKTSNSGDSSNSEVTGSMEAGGQASALLAKGTFKGAAQGKLGFTSSAALSHERLFDATWSLPLNVLDALDELNFISRDISTAKVGDMVLASGVIQLDDIKLLQRIWKPAIELSVGQTKITHANKAGVSMQKKQLSSMGQMLQVMPPLPQMHLADAAGNHVWAALGDDNMLVDMSSIALCHGTVLRGTWHVLGLLDALPDTEITTHPPFQGSELLGFARDVVGSLREIVGRPVTAFGMTPVLIFREVSKG